MTPECKAAAVRTADQTTDSTAAAADRLCIGCSKTDRTGTHLRQGVESGLG